MNITRSPLRTQNSLLLAPKSPPVAAAVTAAEAEGELQFVRGEQSNECLMAKAFRKNMWNQESRKIQCYPWSRRVHDPVLNSSKERAGPLRTVKVGRLGTGRVANWTWSIKTVSDIVGRSLGSSCTHKSPLLYTSKLHLYCKLRAALDPSSPTLYCHSIIPVPAQLKFQYQIKGPLEMDKIKERETKWTILTQARRLDISWD